MRAPDEYAANAESAVAAAAAQPYSAAVYELARAQVYATLAVAAATDAGVPRLCTRCGLRRRWTRGGVSVSLWCRGCVVAVCCRRYLETGRACPIHGRAALEPEEPGPQYRRPPAPSGAEAVRARIEAHERDGDPADLLERLEERP